MVALGLLLTLAVEFVVPRGLDVGRMNTVYKIYLQVWLLWGLAAAAAAARLYGQLPRRPRRFRAWHYGFVAFVAAALLYPLFAMPARIADRFDRAVPPTLDGTAFMDRATVADRDQRIPLADDRDAIRWIEETLPGSPIVAEVNTAPLLYGWGNRYAVYTGNPTPIGWDWHERQQRGMFGRAITWRAGSPISSARMVRPTRTRRTGSLRVTGCNISSWGGWNGPTIRAGRGSGRNGAMCSGRWCTRIRGCRFTAIGGAGTVATGGR